jgi:hypothetical protein
MLTLKPSLALDALVTSIKSGEPMHFHGAPGVGKTSLVHQAAEVTNRRVLVTRLSLIEPVDLYGVPFVVKNAVVQAKPAFFPKEGEPDTIWFFDEWLQGTTAVQNAAGQLVNERHLGDYALPDNVYICAASNRAKDRAGTNRMPSHIATRWTHIEVEEDVNDWVKWALTHDVATEVIAFIKFRNELLSKFDPNELASPTPRSWEKVSNIRRSDPPAAVEHALYAGRVGEAAAAEFMGFLNIMRTLPNPDQVLMNPDKAIVPDQPATLYALCGVLARKATENNMDRVVKYANRLPEEFSVTMIKQATDRDPELSNTRAFISWASDHQEALS